MLTLHTANRYEDLRERLLDDFAAGTGNDPFARRQIIVPSMAVKRDLQLAVARRSGVCAGVEFPFLAQWLWDCFGRLVEVPPVSPFSPQRLTWRLYRIFADPAFVQGQPRLAHFLAAADDTMRLELAERVAQGFEQLLTYRPEWLEAWSQHRRADLPLAANRADEAWQAALWRQVTGELGTHQEHPATRFFTALSDLGPAGVRRAGLPQAVSLFALSTLPPLYLRQLRQLAEHLDIRLYLLNPCQEFWFDIVDRRRLTRLQAAGRADFHETGNRLLAGWGRQTQSLFSLLFEQDDLTEASARFVAHPDTLLGQLQNSILHLQELPPTTLAADDRSIEIHVCHSLTRQLEALHDRLLALSATLPDLQADQILVALPDLESAAPLIDAVFGTRGRLPYTVTGRPASRSNAVARALLALLDAATSRLPASTGLALLREPLIARRLRLSEADVEVLAECLREAGLHWGLDARQREATLGDEGMADSRHTWRDALGRLLLGHARPAGDDVPFLQSLPAGELGGSQGRLLGALWQFLERLEQLALRLSRPQPAARWQEIWMQVLDQWLWLDDSQVEAARDVREALARCAGEMAEGDADRGKEAPFRLPASVARTALEQALDAGPQGGIPGGTITFAALPSLRALPYRVVCLLGLDDGVFPGQSRPPEFDLMGQDYRPGDRQRRIDDRNLFLDLLLAAREILHLSYTGRSQRDDAPLPPSVLLAELRDTLGEALGNEQAARLVVSHPLQAFSRRYFEPETVSGDTRLFSYDAAVRDALQAGRPGGILPVFAAELPPLPLPRTLPLTALQAFFRHPARGYLRDRLGLRLADAETDLDDDEPLVPTREAGWALDARLLPAALADVAPGDLVSRALAGVELPGGTLGRVFAEAHSERVAGFARVLRPALQETVLPPRRLAVLVTVAGLAVTVQAVFNDLRPTGRVRYRLARLGVGDHVSAWLEHLLLCAAAPADLVPETRLYGLDENTGVAQLTLGPVADAATLLGDWLEAWWAGQHTVLPLPPRTAWASLDESDPAKVWRDDYTGRGEQDAWWELAWRGQLPDGGLYAADPSAEALRAGMADWVARLLAPLHAQIHAGATPDD